MSELTLGKTSENKRSWLLPLLIVVLIAAAGITALGLAGAFSPAATVENTPESPQALWESQEVNSYRYTLQVSCFCLVDMTKPVLVEVIDGQVDSITYVEDGTAASLELFESYSSVDKLFGIIDNAAAQDPALMDVTYDETFGVPQEVNIDISEMMADEEIYFTVSGFEPIK